MKFVIISDGSQTFETTRDIDQDDNTRCNSGMGLVSVRSEIVDITTIRFLLNRFGSFSKYTGREENFTILGFRSDYFVC